MIRTQLIFAGFLLGYSLPSINAGKVELLFLIVVSVETSASDFSREEFHRSNKNKCGHNQTSHFRIIRDTAFFFNFNMAMWSCLLTMI